MTYSIINIASIHEDLPHTKSKYMVNSLGKRASGMVVGVQQGIELQLRTALQQIWKQVLWSTVKAIWGWIDMIVSRAEQSNTLDASSREY